MRKRGDGLPRHQIPELGGFVPTCRQDPCTIRTKRRYIRYFPMVEGGDELAGGRIPKLNGFVRARRQDPSAVRTKRPMPDPILMSQ